MLTSLAKNTMLDNLGVTQVAIFSQEPVDISTGVIGTALPITFDTASGGVLNSTQSIPVPITAPATVTHIGLFDANNSLLLSQALPTPVEYTEDGGYLIGIVTVDLNAVPA